MVCETARTSQTSRSLFGATLKVIAERVSKL